MAELTGKPISELPSLSYVPNASLFACTNGESASRSASFLTMRDSVLRRGTLIGNADDLNNYTTAGFYYLSWTSGTTAVQNWPYDNYGGLLLVFIGNNGDSRVQIAIISGSGNCPVFIRRYSGSAWSAWRTVTYDGITPSGGTMTGSLVINTLQDATQANANLRLKDSRFAIGDNVDSTTVAGRVQYWDKNQDAVAFVNGQYNANKVSQLQMSAQSKKDGAAVNNTLTLGVNTNGERTVSVSDSSAWRAAILNSDAINEYNATTNPGGYHVESPLPSGFTNIEDIGIETSGYVVSVTAKVTVSANPSTEWQDVITGLPRPKHNIFLTVPTNDSEYGRLRVRLAPGDASSGGRLQFARGTATKAYDFTLTYIAR